jgi:hypothetical protein
MSSTTKNVKNKVSQPDPKNFIEKRVEIPEVLKAQQPPPKPVPVEVRKLEKPQPVPIPVVETTPVAVFEPPKVEIPAAVTPMVKPPVEMVESPKTEPPKVRILIKSRPSKEEKKQQVPVPVPVPEDKTVEEVDFKSFVKTIEEEVDRNKGMIATVIVENGEELIKEIEAKRHVETVKKYGYIPYILKHSKETRTAEELLSYNLNDVKAIYLDIKETRRSKGLFAKIAKFFKFLFNMQ